MNVRPKINLSAAGAEAGGGFFLPQTQADPGQTVQVFSSDPQTAAPSPAPQIQVDPLVAQPQTQWVYEPVKVNQVAPPGQPAADPNAAAQQQPAQQQQAAPPAQETPPVPDGSGQDQPALSADGTQILVWRPDPLNPGRMSIYTRVPNSPAAISQYLAQEAQYKDDLRAALHQRRYDPPPQAQPSQPQAPPPTLAEKYEAIAAKYANLFPEDIDTTPLQKMVGAVLAELKSEELQEQQQYARHQEIEAQLQHLEKTDPSFRLDHPLVINLRRQFPQATPLEIHQKMVYLNYMATQNGQPPVYQQQPGVTVAPPVHVQPAGQQQQAAPAQRPMSPPNMFVNPQGTQPTQLMDPLDNHPEVVDAVAKHAKFMADVGKQATPESTARARESVKMAIRNRGTFIATPNRPLGA